MCGNVQLDLLTTHTSPASIRDKVDSLSYGRASHTAKERKTKSALLIDILEQPFKSYPDVATSLLRLMACPTIFQITSNGGVLLSVGDWPKQQMERLLILQGDGRHHDDDELGSGPIRLAKLLKLCSPMMYTRALEANGLDPSSEDDACVLANALQNILQVLGPLHCRINPIKDIWKFWHSIFLGPLNMAIRKRSIYNEKQMPLRDITALCEILLAGYESIRDAVRETLIPIANRFDASALLFLFESTLPLANTLYDGVYKSGLHEQYKEGLCFLQFQMLLWQRHNYKYAVLYKIASMLWHKDHSSTELYDLGMCCCTIHHVTNMQIIYIHIYISQIKY